MVAWKGMKDQKKSADVTKIMQQMSAALQKHKAEQWAESRDG